MIKFVEVTNENVWTVINLKVAADQEEFVAPNVVSLAEAYATRNEGHVALPFAIYNDETLIGFIMFGYGGTGDDDEPQICEGNYVLWRLMLDERYQHQGFGVKILDKAMKYLRSAPAGKGEYVWLSYESENEHGRKVYERYGFKENGEKCGDEIVAVMKL